ncbi:hypothetical protein BaRGS_00003169 [Batillaria attramentaria]|uniref:Uncharacterized protein n=1 Tax=Batillaria attramentaria TaxID=370345 RepID=A0ABD0M0Y9_9CAEN
MHEATALKSSLDQLTAESDKTHQDLHKKCEDLELRLQQLTEEKEKGEAKAAELERQRNAVREELEAARHTSQQVQARLDMLQMDLDDNEGMVDDLNGKLTQESQAIADLKARLTEKEERLKESTTDLEKTGLKLAESLDRGVALESEIQQLRVNISQQESALADKNQQIEKLTSELKAAREELGSLGERLSARDKAESEMQEEAERLCQKLIFKDETLARLLADLQAKEKELEDLNDTCAQLEEDLEKSARTIKAREDTIKATQEHMEKLVATLAEERDARAAEKEGLEGEIARPKKKSPGSRSNSWRKTRKPAGELEKEKQSLQQQAQGELQALQKELDQERQALQDQKESLQSEKRSLQEQLAEERRRRSEETEHQQKLLQEKAELEGRLKEMEESRPTKDKEPEKDGDGGEDTVEELRSQLAHSKQETEFYLEKHNKLLEDIVTLRKEKENAVCLLERFKYRVQLKRRRDAEAANQKTPAEPVAATSTQSLPDSLGQNTSDSSVQEHKHQEPSPQPSHLTSDKSAATVSQKQTASFSPTISDMFTEGHSVVKDPSPSTRASGRSCLSLRHSPRTRSSPRLAAADSVVASDSGNLNKDTGAGKNDNSVQGSIEVPSASKKAASSSLSSAFGAPMRVAAKIPEASSAGQPQPNEGEELPGVMTRRRLSLSKRKSEQHQLGSPAAKQPKVASPEPAAKVQAPSRPATRASYRTSRLQPPSSSRLQPPSSSRTGLPTKKDLLTKPASHIPHFTSSSTGSSTSQATTSSSSGQPKALATITNSPKKAPSGVRGLRKIPAPSRPRFSPEIPKAVEATKASKERSARTANQVNDCKQS